MSKVAFAEPFFRHPQNSMCYLTEKPYPVDDGVLSWVSCQLGPDSAQGALHLYDFYSRQNRTVTLPGRLGFAVPTSRKGIFLVGCNTTLALFNFDTQAMQTLCDISDYEPEGTTINDGIVFGDTVIFGTKELEGESRRAGLYLWRKTSDNDSPGKLSQLRSKQSISNGKAVRVISSDSEKTYTLLDIDSPTKKLQSYPLNLEAGSVGEPETVLDFNDGSPVPDGALLLANGNHILISMYDMEDSPFGETRLYDLDSRACLETWQTPNAPRSTCPTIVPFMKSNLLVITTAMSETQFENFTDTEIVNAGSLFYREVSLDAAECTPPFSIDNLQLTI